MFMTKVKLAITLLVTLGVGASFLGLGIAQLPGSAPGLVQAADEKLNPPNPLHNTEPGVEDTALPVGPNPQVFAGTGLAAGLYAYAYDFDAAKQLDALDQEMSRVKIQLQTAELAVASLKEKLRRLDRLKANSKRPQSAAAAQAPVASHPGPHRQVTRSSAQPATEGTMRSLPEYVVEPPDLITVEVLEALRGRPISGERLVRPDGRISLGFYGEVYVAGLTPREIKEKVILHLQKFLADDVLGLRKDDEKDPNKTVPVAPMDSDRVFVEVSAYNSKVYYVHGYVVSPGRFPITGGDTVLDAITNAGGLQSSSMPLKISLIRPAVAGTQGREILPVDLNAIIKDGDPSTNYQLLPGDRLEVETPPTALHEPLPGPSRAEVEERIDVILKELETLKRDLGKPTTAGPQPPESSPSTSRVAPSPARPKR
jgi:protein involved in polysaccharide export with SLBB domain